MKKNQTKAQALKQIELLPSNSAMWVWKLTYSPSDDTSNEELYASWDRAKERQLALGKIEVVAELVCMEVWL
jgi:hypothetical protein